MQDWRIMLLAVRAWLSIHKRALLLGLLLGTMIGQAIAGTATVSWTNPTTNVDGSPIGTITGTRVEYGSCSGTAFGTKAGEQTASGAATSIVITLPAGAYCFRAYTQTAAGESAASNVASKVIPAPLPNPPTITTIAVVAGVDHVPAFRILADGTRSTTVAGFVPVGTACTGPVVFTYRSRSYRRVDPSAVKWWQTSPTSSIAAACA